MIAWIIILSIIVVILVTVIVALMKDRPTNETPVFRNHTSTTPGEGIEPGNQLDDAAVQAELSKLDAAKTELNLVSEQVEIKIAQVSQLDETINSTTAKIKDVLDQFERACQELQAIQEQKNVAAQSVIENDERTNSLRIEATTLERRIVELTGQLDALGTLLNDAKITNRSRLLGDDDIVSFDFGAELNNKEHRLVELLGEVSNAYPELASDLATIEWKRIWLPHLQRTSNMTNTRGIYRLVLKTNPDICYVGQAVNIKERWYEHAKKMIGADKKGNELLYDYRPEDFVWMIVETGCEDLNKAERYWIDYYCCREKGLNRK